MISILSGFLRDEAGQGITEYGLIIALVTIAAISALNFFGISLINNFYTLSIDKIAGILNP